MADTDGSGYLTPDEMVGILTREAGGIPMSVLDAHEFMGRFDSNSDGVFNIQEVCSPSFAFEAVQDSPRGAICLARWYEGTPLHHRPILLAVLRCHVQP